MLDIFKVKLAKLKRVTKNVKGFVCSLIRDLLVYCCRQKLWWSSEQVPIDRTVQFEYKVLLIVQKMFNKTSLRNIILKKKTS